MPANTAPRLATSMRVPASAPRRRRQGRRQAAKTRAAEAIRIQATPSTSTRAKSSTANEGPR